ncbi:MAG: hypothetical protein PHI18_09245 [bacterium]|nr:hypothetical protein [bacterium]
MIREDVYRKLPEYMDGGLPEEERREIEEWLAGDEELANAFSVSQQIDRYLSEQDWREPSALFTQQVVARARIYAARPEPSWVRVWEPTKIAVSFFTVGLLLAISGHTLWRMMMDSLRSAGVWLDAVIGITLFAVNPLVLLTIIVPVVGVGWATCVATGRCRAVS